MQIHSTCGVALSPVSSSRARRFRYAGFKAVSPTSEGCHPDTADAQWKDPRLLLGLFLTAKSLEAGVSPESASVQL